MKYLYKNQITSFCDTEEAEFYSKAETDVCRSLVPDFSEIDFSRYPRLADDTNPMHSIWNDGAWLKAYMAHGCYWHRCAFCDTSLEYVNRFCKVGAEQLCDGLTEQAEKTAQNGRYREYRSVLANYVGARNDLVKAEQEAINSSDIGEEYTLRIKRVKELTAALKELGIVISKDSKGFLSIDASATSASSLQIRPEQYASLIREATDPIEKPPNAL